MRFEVVSLLVNENYDALCENYKLYDFQARMLSFMYTSTDNERMKDSIVTDIISGKYTVPVRVRDMFKTFIDKAVKHSKDHGFGILTEKCRLKDDEARTFLDIYLKADKNVDELLSAELDVSNTNIRMNEMIDELLPNFLDNERGIVL